jgi:hypothetical protein
MHWSSGREQGWLVAEGASANPFVSHLSILTVDEKPAHAVIFFPCSENYRSIDVVVRRLDEKARPCRETETSKGEEMKKTAIIITVAVMSAGWIQAALLAGWDTHGTGPISSNAPNVIAGGVSAFIGQQVEPAFGTVGGGFSVSTTLNSDTTFGNIAGASAASDSSITLRMNNNNNRQLDIKITNTSGFNMTLDGFHFDYRKQNASTTGTTIELIHLKSVSDLNGWVGQSLDTQTPVSNYVWYDVDVVLTNTILNDVVLADGESAAFRLRVTDTDEFLNWQVDNIGITGTVIPEPATLGLITAFGGAVLFIRRRFMI